MIEALKKVKRENKIKELCYKINFHDVALLEKVLEKESNISFTEKQKERIEKIKNEIEREGK